MKKFTLLFALILVSIYGVKAQWITNGTYIYNNPLTNKVGIGITNPKAHLQIGFSSTDSPVAPTTISIANSYLHIGGQEFNLNSYKLITFGYNGGTMPLAYIGYKGTDPNTSYGYGDLVFGTKPASSNGSDVSATERMRINSEGNVGIGTTIPSYPLHIETSMTDASVTVLKLCHRSATLKEAAIIELGANESAAHVKILGYSNPHITTNSQFEVQTYCGAENAWKTGLYQSEVGYVGIGTTTPSALLEINKAEGPLAFSIKRGSKNVASIGSGTTGTGEVGILSLYNNSVENIRLYTSGDSWINGGNVGIGTNTPLYPLHLDTPMTDASVTVLKLCHRSATLKEAAIIELGANESVAHVKILGYSNPHVSNNSQFEVQTYCHAESAWKTGLYQNEIGNVGIGTTNTNTYKLTINGTIAAREVKVTAEAWADFVFHPTYKLRTLGEVEQFIKTNKHLPEIPTETEVKQNGVGLGEMNAKLLQKIEELTLYMIEQQKVNEKQNQLIKELEEKIENIANKQ